MLDVSLRIACKSAKRLLRARFDLSLKGVDYRGRLKTASSLASRRFELSPNGFAAMPDEKMNNPIEEEDFYREGEFIVFTRQYHLKRGYCCGSGCRHCPYEPRRAKGATAVAAEKDDRQLDQSAA